MDYRYIDTKSPSAEVAVGLALRQGYWLIGGDFHGEPFDFSKLVLENVFRLEEKGGPVAKRFGKEVLICYGISPAVKGDLPYRIHDDVIWTMDQKDTLSVMVKSILDTYDIVILEKDMVDRTAVFGKLGTDRENEVILVNKKERGDKHE